MLGVLLLHAGMSCSADMLLQDIWGMTSPQTPAALRLVVSRVRQAVQPGRLITRAESRAYQADPLDAIGLLSVGHGHRTLPTIFLYH